MGIKTTYNITRELAIQAILEKVNLAGTDFRKSLPSNVRLPSRNNRLITQYGN